MIPNNRNLSKLEIDYFLEKLSSLICETIIDTAPKIKTYNTTDKFLTPTLNEKNYSILCQLLYTRTHKPFIYIKQHIQNMFHIMVHACRYSNFRDILKENKGLYGGSSKF